MANRHWVGGSAAWDATAGSKWSTTSGGGSGAAVPTAADDVFFDASSGAVTITGAAGNVCRSLTCTGFTGTYTIPSSATALTVGDASGGALLFVSGMTLTLAGGSALITFASTSTNGGAGWGVTTGGKTMPSMTFSGAGGKWVCQDNYTSVDRTISHTAGTLDLNGKTFTLGTISSTGATSRTLTLGAATITLTSAWTLSGSNLTFSGASSTIAFGGFAAGAGSTSRTFAGFGQTYGTLTFTIADVVGTLALTGANTFSVLNIGSGRTLTLPASTTTTISTTWNVNGVANGYVRLPGGSGNYASVPDSAALSIVGNLDVRARVAAADWTPAAEQGLVSKWNATGNQRGFILSLLTNGKLRLYLSADGTAATTVDSSTTPTISDGQTLWVRATYRISDRRVQFFTASGALTSPSSGDWTQLGTDQTQTATAIFDNTAEVNVGAWSAGTANTAIGNFYAVDIRNNILDDGTGIQLLANFAAKAVGANTFTESSSNAATVTINGVNAQVGDGRVNLISSSAGTAATVSQSAGTNQSVYISVKDSTATGGATWIALSPGTVDVSGNTGWLFRSTVDAVLAAPLGALTGTIAATPDHPATLAAPLGALTATATAAPDHPATLAAPLGALVATAAATPDHPATLDAPLGALVAAATATPDHPAVLAAPLGALVATATADVTHDAVLDAPLGALVATAAADVTSGSATVDAVLDAPLGSLVASLTATPDHPATLDAPLGSLVATAAAEHEHPAALDAPLGSLTAAASATVDHPATLAADLGALVATAAAGVEHAATFAAPLGALAANADATVDTPDVVDAVLSAPLGALTATASAGVEHPATLSAPLGELTAAATATPDHPATLTATLGALAATIDAAVSHVATADAPLGPLVAQVGATVTRFAVLQAVLGGLTANIYIPVADTAPHKRTYRVDARTSYVLDTSSHYRLDARTRHSVDTTTAHRIDGRTVYAS